jgi:hypothetical protein
MIGFGLVASMKKILIFTLAALFCCGSFAQTIKLPAPRTKGGIPLMEALSKRSTAREFSPRELSFQQLSELLWASFGVNRPDGKRTAPSARNWQETDIYVLLEKGAYRYNAQSNRLDLEVAADLRQWGGTQDFVKNAPVTLVFVADLSKMGGTEQDKRDTANIDVGYISQNAYLWCASEGLVTGARGNIDRATLSKKLRLRPTQLIILAQSVGYPKP